MKKVAVILSGCGVYDGSEIHESVFALLSIAAHGAEYACFAPDVKQHHVINHLTGEETGETRNVLVEAARIARGQIRDLATYKASEFDALVIPGGFGAAKNLTQWAFDGPEGQIQPEVKRAIVETVKKGKPIAALCMGPTVVAKALEDAGLNASLTVGTTEEASPYDIKAISAGIDKTGSKAVMKNVREVAVDTQNRIVTAPCYMMEAGINEVYLNTRQAIDTLFRLI